MKHRRSPGHAARHGSGLISIQDIRPTVELAGYWSWPGPGECWWQYRAIRSHWMLIETGGLKAHTALDHFETRAPALVCFRPAARNTFGLLAGTRTFQLLQRFAPPPNAHLVPSLDEIGPIPLHLPLGDAFDRVRRLFEMICMELPRTPVSRQLRIRGAVYELLAIIDEVSRSRERGSRTPTTAAATAGAGRARSLDVFERSRNRLESQLDQPLRISELAGEAGLSVEHFIRRFRQRFGINPAAFRTRAKLAEAARQLRAGDRAVKSVAYSLGFRDPDAFARLFKRHIGVAPSRCRPRTDAGELAAKVAQLMPAEQTLPGGLIPVNAHVMPSDMMHAQAFDQQTEWVAHCYPPRRDEDYIYRAAVSASARMRRWQVRSAAPR